MAIQVCPFHADEGVRGTPLHDEAGTTAFECQRRGHPRPGPWTWSSVPEPPSSMAASGLAAELGLHTELPAAIASHGGRWVEYGLVERAYARTQPEDFRRIVRTYGHNHLAPSQYTASAYLARTLGDLSRHGTVLFRVGRATGRWSYNEAISYWAVSPEPDWNNRLSWEDAAATMDYVE